VKFETFSIIRYFTDIFIDLFINPLFNLNIISIYRDVLMELNIESRNTTDLVLPKIPDISPGNDHHFKIELNLGLALPFRYHIDENSKIKKHKSIVRSIDENGSVLMLEISTQSDEGPLQAVENDVLLVLLTMAFDQRKVPAMIDNVEQTNNHRVYYTLAEICKRLGLSENNSTRVSKAIKRIGSQNLSFKNFRYHSPTGKIIQAEENTKIILKNGRVRYGSTKDGFLANHSDVFYVEFDHNIIRNLYDEYVSLVEQKEYLSLSSGNHRRVLIFLYSKKRNYGNSFIFSLNELAQVIGLQDSLKDKRRRLIFEYIQRTQEVTTGFDFSITKRKGEEDWDVMVQFSDEKLIESKMEPFYQALVNEYTQEKLNSVDFKEIDLGILRDEFDKYFEGKAGHAKFSWNKNEYLASEFCLDLTFWQVFYCDYKITKTLKALARSILESMISGNLLIPDKYRYFISERVMEKKKQKDMALINQHRVAKELQKIEEEKKFDESFNKMFVDLMNDNKYKKVVTEEAKKRLEKEGMMEGEMTYTLLLQDETRKVAKEYIQDFKLFDKRPSLQ
jgi:hypothetical protein